MCYDNISRKGKERLQDHFFLCNDTECEVCQLFGEGVAKLSEAWQKLKATKLVIKIIEVV